jgi:signal transduction histidine kinase
MIFRIIQEIINNALKHAQSTSISVTFRSDEKYLMIIAEDNGIGFNVEEHKNEKRSGKGLGLFNIENRARLVSADVEFHSAPQQGTRIVLNIPYEKV